MDPLGIAARCLVIAAVPETKRHAYIDDIRKRLTSLKDASWREVDAIHRMIPFADEEQRRALVRVGIRLAPSYMRFETIAALAEWYNTKDWIEAVERVKGITGYAWRRAFHALDLAARAPAVHRETLLNVARSITGPNPRGDDGRSVQGFEFNTLATFAMVETGVEADERAEQALSYVQAVAPDLDTAADCSPWWWTRFAQIATSRFPHKAIAAFMRLEEDSEAWPALVALYDACLPGSDGRGAALAALKERLRTRAMTWGIDARAIAKDLKMRRGEPPSVPSNELPPAFEAVAPAMLRGDKESPREAPTANTKAEMLVAWVTEHIEAARHPIRAQPAVLSALLHAIRLDSEDTTARSSVSVDVFEASLEIIVHAASRPGDAALLAAALVHALRGSAQKRAVALVLRALERRPLYDSDDDWKQLLKKGWWSVFTAPTVREALAEALAPAFDRRERYSDPSSKLRQYWPALVAAEMADDVARLLEEWAETEPARMVAEVVIR